MTPCQICGAPATRTVTDHEHLPDVTFWAVDTKSPPWHLCDAHSASVEDCRRRLAELLVRADRLIAESEEMAEGLRDAENITLAGEMRALLLEMRASIEAKLERIS